MPSYAWYDLCVGRVHAWAGLKYGTDQYGVHAWVGLSRVGRVSTASMPWKDSHVGRAGTASMPVFYSRVYERVRKNSAVYSTEQLTSYSQKIG